MSHFTDFTGYVVFIITSFLAGVESADQCLLNSKVLSCFTGVIMSIRSFFLLCQFIDALCLCRDLYGIAYNIRQDTDWHMKIRIFLLDTLCQCRYLWLWHALLYITADQTMIGTCSLCSRPLFQRKILLVPRTEHHLSSFKCSCLNIFWRPKTCCVVCHAYCFCYGGTNMARKNA